MRRTNLLFITTDQQRQDSLPCYGLDFLKTPNLDRLAREGMVLDRCYVSSPICVPCRSTLMSGQYALSTGALNNFTWLEEDVPVWPAYMSQAGYSTAAIGKMHFTPWDHMGGFQDRIICEDKRHTYLPDNHYQYLEANGLSRPHPTDHPGYFESLGAPTYLYGREFYPDVFVGERAAEWLKGIGDKPFATWVSFPGPHDPYDPPLEYAEMYAEAPIPKPLWAETDRERHAYKSSHGSERMFQNSMFRIRPTEATPEQFRLWRSHYYADISVIDEGIGRIIAALEETGALENTLIIFTSDHGDALGDHGLVFKGHYLESMTKVPLLVRGPGITPGSRSDALISTVDLVAAFFDVCSVDPPDTLQGVSSLPVFRGQTEQIRGHLFSDLDGHSMVFDGRHKYIYYSGHGAELYDLEGDPEEFNNLSGQSDISETEKRLLGLLLEHHLECAHRRCQAARVPRFPERERLEAEYERELRNKGLL